MIKIEQTGKRRNGLMMPCFVCLAFVLVFVQPGYAAEDAAKFPSRPITFICPLMAGSTGDLTNRIIAKSAEKFLGQPVVVVNKTGGGTTIGTAAVASAKPDGYTIGYTTPSSMLVAPFLERLPYDPLKDFQQIIQYSAAAFSVYVRGDSRFKDFKEVIAYARQNPNKLTYCTSGALSIGHFTMVQLAKKENIKFNHIPFKGGPEYQAAVMGGHVDFAVGDFNYPLLESGQIRLLAVLVENRLAEYGHVPTFRDLGYDAPEVPPAPMYQNVAGPKGMPREVVKKLEEAFTLATKDPAFIAGLKEMRFPVIYRNSKDMTDYIARYYELYRKMLSEMDVSKK